MKYLCLAYYDEKKFETLTEAEMAAIGRDCGPLDEDLQRSGHLLEVGAGSGGFARAALARGWIVDVTEISASSTWFLACCHSLVGVTFSAVPS